MLCSVRGNDYFLSRRCDATLSRELMVPILIPFCSECRAITNPRQDCSVSAYTAAAGHYFSMLAISTSAPQLGLPFASLSINNRSYR